MVNGDLTLGDLTLNIVEGANWPTLSTLVLFTYSGSFIGGPPLSIGQVPVGFTFDQFLTDGGVTLVTPRGD